MRALLVLLIACVPPPPHPAPRIVLSQPVVVQPPPAVRGPTLLALEPFAEAVLTPSSEPVTAGSIRKLHSLTKIGTIDSAVFENPRRVVVASATRWWLVDPIANRVIAEIGKPSARLSATELVVRTNFKDSVVDLRDGTALVPAPTIPIDAPIDTLYIAHANEQDGSDWYEVERAEAGADVFLVAIAGGRRFVGPWNDRAHSPRLVEEIEETRSGWRATRRTTGLDLHYGVPKDCTSLLLHPTRSSECLTDPDELVNTGTWEVSVHGDRLLAHDTATLRDEAIALPCSKPRIDGRSLDDPRAFVQCDNQLITWTPGHARVLSTTERVPGYVLFGRLVPLEAAARFDQVGERWLDLDTGTVLRGPSLSHLDIATNGSIVAFSGTGLATRGVLIDARGTLRDLGPMPCRGEILLDDVKASYTAFSCGLRVSPGTYDFVRAWSRIVDTQHAKVYELPGYPAAIFADGTVILSNRTRLTAETRGPLATLTVAHLD